ncbi:hypothetical protein V6N13_050964 [Hibiscus sabdariffa]|uniref:Uncharacterized protein n=1 Tax=Hibiscus sabdariffa TaxID=183260 RepID=A0ABR2T255_9ROSI
MSEKLSLLSCFNFQNLGSWHGSFSHGSPTPPTSLAGLQNYLRSCSEVISIVWLSPIERPRRSSRAFEEVMVVGWKRVYVGRRILLRSGKFCLRAFTEKEGKYGFFFGFGQVGVSIGTIRSLGGRSSLSRSPNLFLPLSNPCFEVVDNPMGFLLCVEFDDVFILGILAVKVSGEAMNLTVAVICVFIASPPVDITSAGAMVSTTSHELTRVWSWLSYKGFVDYNSFVLFLFEWYADNAFETLGPILHNESLRVQVANIEMAGVRWIMDSWGQHFSSNSCSWTLPLLILNEEGLTSIALLARVPSTFVVPSR